MEEGGQRRAAGQAACGVRRVRAGDGQLLPAEAAPLRRFATPCTTAWSQTQVHAPFTLGFGQWRNPARAVLFRPPGLHARAAHGCLHAARVLTPPFHRLRRGIWAFFCTIRRLPGFGLLAYHTCRQTPRLWF